nr:MAG TPA: hypothetical protein [Caudoviricetes sp.]
MQNIETDATSPKPLDLAIRSDILSMRSEKRGAHEADAVMQRWR